jgi:hypothetical protein
MVVLLRGLLLLIIRVRPSFLKLTALLGGFLTGGFLTGVFLAGGFLTGGFLGVFSGVSLAGLAGAFFALLFLSLTIKDNNI